MAEISRTLVKAGLINYYKVVDDVAGTYYEADRQTPRGSPEGLAERCAVCGYIEPREKLVKFQGLWYCTPRGHDKDIRKLALEQVNTRVRRGGPELVPNEFES